MSAAPSDRIIARAGLRLDEVQRAALRFGRDVADLVERISTVEVGQAMPANAALNLSRDAAELAARLTSIEDLGMAWVREAAHEQSTRDRAAAEGQS